MGRFDVAQSDSDQSDDWIRYKTGDGKTVKFNRKMKEKSSEKPMAMTKGGTADDLLKKKRDRNVAANLRHETEIDDLFTKMSKKLFSKSKSVKATIEENSSANGNTLLALYQEGKLFFAKNKKNDWRVFYPVL